MDHGPDPLQRERGHSAATAAAARAAVHILQLAGESQETGTSYKYKKIVCVTPLSLFRFTHGIRIAFCYSITGPGKHSGTLRKKIPPCKV